MDFVTDWQFVIDGGVNVGISVYLELMWLSAFGEKATKSCKDCAEIFVVFCNR
jgi:hypothetical protein